MKTPEQLGFDFGAPAEDGYKIWQWERKQCEQRIAKAWNLPVGKKVRIKLVNIDGEFQGRLELARLPLSINNKNPLKIKIGTMRFDSTEIEKCTVIKTDDQH